jgi:hypothetical protein
MSVSFKRTSSIAAKQPVLTGPHSNTNTRAMSLKFCPSLMQAGVHIGMKLSFDHKVVKPVYESDSSVIFGDCVFVDKSKHRRKCKLTKKFSNLQQLEKKDCMQ